MGSSRQWASPCQWARPVSGLAPSVGLPRLPCEQAGTVSGFAPSVGWPHQWARPPSVGSPRQWARLVSGRFQSAICSRPGLARDTGQASHYGRGVSLVKFQTFPLLVRSNGGSVWLVRLAPHEGKSYRSLGLWAFHHIETIYDL